MELTKIKYREMKREELKNCNHIWVITSIIQEDYDGHNVEFHGCMKCGLDEQLHSDYSLSDQFLSLEQQAMIQVLQNRSYFNGIKTDVVCDLNLARAIYTKIKQAHPELDDETTRKYFEIALQDIRTIAVNETRKESRAKRLQLLPRFNRWHGTDVTL